MAFRVLVLAACAGCILPPPVEEGSDVQNQPPRILVETLSPPPRELPKTLSLECSQYLFFANVQDPDPTDTIYYRVFIDYKNDSNPLQTVVHTKLPDDTNPGAARLITFQVDPTDDRFGLGDTKLVVSHAIELLISDRPFLTVDRDPVARAVEDDGLTDSFTWPAQLRLENDPGCVE